MFNKNYLGHDLVATSDYNNNYTTIYLVCLRCKSQIRYYRDTEYYNLFGAIYLLTCDEVIIKNIIE